ncbi:hypothetical protein V1525DRAFT_338186 [Lipomyces kononenkoae]|uniref:Uncharacterized protein n=1 Tax=Lipomyces kononenkoae TaxID=34357 RepID=A0ACC3TAW7_LIPKO
MSSVAADSAPRRPRLSAAFRSYSNSRLARASASASANASQPSLLPAQSASRPRSHTLGTPSATPVAPNHSILSASLPASVSTTPSASTADIAGPSTSGLRSPESSTKADDEEPSIRMTPFIDHSSTTPALYFEPIERRGRSGNVIRLGRYTDKKEFSKLEAAHAPVVFKSKVVSRSHAELWVENGQWFVKDIKSSSGTFLNHIRLSPACQVSQAFPIKDGDVLQLGMDFRGGSEEVYKCVKMRLEINRSWQKRINNFNVSAHTRLRSLTQSQPTQVQQQECSICLVAVAPCQSLFVAPCSHVWHYKCIRPIIIRNYPQFLCPNCRAVCDLEADVEVPDQPMIFEASMPQEKSPEGIVDEVLANSGSDEGSGSSSGEAANEDEELSASVMSRMNVMTPSNEAGPFVFDGMVVDNTQGRQLTQSLLSDSVGNGTDSSTPASV